MSTREKRLPNIEKLRDKHQTYGNSYITQFLDCDTLCGSADSIKYMEDFIKNANSLDQMGIINTIEYNPTTDKLVIAFLKEAKLIMMNNILEYKHELREIQRVIDSLNNKVNQ
jgi:hypothetical protein